MIKEKIHFLKKYLKTQNINTEILNIPGVFSKNEYLETDSHIITPHWLSTFPLFPINKEYKQFKLSEMVPVRGFIYPLNSVKMNKLLHIFGICYMYKKNTFIQDFIKEYAVDYNIKHHSQRNVPTNTKYETFSDFTIQPSKVLYIITPEDYLVRHDVEMLLIQLLASDAEIYIKFDEIKEFKLYNILNQHCTLEFDGSFYKVIKDNK